MQSYIVIWLIWQKISTNFSQANLKFNTLRQRQNGRRFADETFKCIFLNENVRISIAISLKFVPKGPINNIPALVQIMAWRRSGNKPLSEPICVTRPQWVNWNFISGTGVTMTAREINIDFSMTDHKIYRQGYFKLKISVHQTYVIVWLY